MIGNLMNYVLTTRSSYFTLNIATFFFFFLQTRSIKYIMQIQPFKLHLKFKPSYETLRCSRLQHILQTFLSRYSIFTPDKHAQLILYYESFVTLRGKKVYIYHIRSEAKIMRALFHPEILQWVYMDGFITVFLFCYFLFPTSFSCLQNIIDK